MKPSQVERWVTQVVDEIEWGVRREDDRVELKRQPKSTPLENARRIAGHANQARDGSILWIFGLDEDGTRHPLPAELDDFNTWWEPVAACFDDVAPAPTYVIIDGLAGIGFDTDRLPFVVKHPGNAATREVPWREGTRVRSASRADLLRVLVPLSTLPHLSLLDVEISLFHQAANARQNTPERFMIRFYSSVYAETAEGFVLPDHLLDVRASLPGLGSVPIISECTDHLARGLRNSGPGTLARLAQRGDRQLVVSGSTPFRVNGHLSVVAEGKCIDPQGLAHLDMRLGLSSDKHVTLSTRLGPVDPAEGDEERRSALGTWVMA